MAIVSKSREAHALGIRGLLTVALVVGGLVCVDASSAQAKWGPKSNCGIKAEPKNEHCYAISYRSTKTLADIAADDNETAIVYDWENYAFYDQEQWVSWPGAKSPENVGWVEAGITEGNHIDCCTAYPFYATVTQKGAYHETVAPGPVESGSGKYNYTLIFDSESNGAYHVYWSSETGHPYWFEVARFGGGRPVNIEYEEAGLEAATEINPYHAGRHEVAVSNGGPWYPWSGASRYHDPGVCIGTNRENTAEGNIEWTPGHNEC